MSALAAALLALPVHLATAGPASAPLEGDAAGVVALLEQRSTVGDDVAGDRLRALGEAAVEPVTDLLLREPGSAAIEYDDRRFLLAALPDLPGRALLEELGARGAEAPSLDRGLALLELLAATERPDALQPLLGAFEALPADARQSGVALRRLETSLVQLLNVDPGLCETLGGSAFGPEASPGLARGALEALGEFGRLDALPALERAMRERPSWTERALVSLSRLRPFEQDLRLDRAVELAERFAADPAPELRRAAVEALGTLGDFEQLELLVERLGDADSAVRSAAGNALARASGLALRREEDAWGRWLEAEEGWLDERLPELGEDLGAGDVAAATAALRELAAHPWHRTRVAELLLEAARREELDLARHACALLGRHAGPTGVAGLVELLRDGRDPVRDAAHRAVQVATGAALPLDYFTWREHLTGRR